MTFSRLDKRPNALLTLLIIYPRIVLWFSLWSLRGLRCGGGFTRLTGRLLAWLGLVLFVILSALFTLNFQAHGKGCTAPDRARRVVGICSEFHAWMLVQEFLECGHGFE